jgi:hypothetical protein
MPWTTLFGVAAGFGLLAFVIFAFRQGLQVKEPPENLPPDRTNGGRYLTD